MYKSCKRFDLLNKFYQARNEWSKVSDDLILAFWGCCGRKYTAVLWTGELCVVDGELCVVDGELCVVDGELCVVDGDLCVVDGELCVVHGNTLQC